MGKTNTEKVPSKKERKPKVDTLTYIRRLDRYRWEFLRLSDQYRADWEGFVADYLFDNGFYRRFCPDGCEAEKDTDCLNCPHLDGMWANPSAYSYHYNIKMKSWSVDSYYRNLTQKTLDTLMKYGIRAMPDPDHDYDEVMEDFTVCVPSEKKAAYSHNFLFYTHLHEYGIYEGVYPNVDPNNSPFLTVTVNLSAHDDVVTAFRKLVSQRKKEMYQREDKNLLRKKWSIPQNIHFDVLDEALEVLRVSQTLKSELDADIARWIYKKKKGIDYAQRIGDILEFVDKNSVSDETRENLKNKYLEPIEDQFSKYEFEAGNRLRKAKAILRNVEQGILSHKTQPAAKRKK